MTKKQYRSRRVTAQSTGKKSVASIVAAWACKNPRQLMPVRRCDAGGRQGLEDPADRGCADAAAEFEQLALDPLVSPAVVLDGEPLNERGDVGADWRPSRPVRAGPLPGDQAPVPSQDGAGCDQPGASVAWRVVAGSARRGQRGPARSSRGRGWARRSTATSCRGTSSSLSLDAVDRPGKTSQPQSRTKIRQSRRRDTVDHHS